MKTVVYTCANLAYDQIYSPVVATPGSSMCCFPTAARASSPAGSGAPARPGCVPRLRPSANWFCKFFLQRLFPEAGISIYLDANLLILGDLQPLINDFLARGGDRPVPAWRAQRHRQRIAFCKRVGKIGPADSARGEAQLAAYAAEGLPPDHGLTENAIILCRHDAPGLDGAMDLWWQQLATYTKRDQLSLPYVLWKSGLEAKVWDWSYWSEKSLFPPLYPPPGADQRHPDLPDQQAARRPRPAGPDRRSALARPWRGKPGSPACAARWPPG